MYTTNPTVGALVRLLLSSGYDCDATAIRPPHNLHATVQLRDGATPVRRMHDSRTIARRSLGGRVGVAF